MTVAGLYARISLDRKDGAGVERQLEDCTALAAERGWEARSYIDNNMSAFRARRRPQFEAMLEDLAAGRLGAIVAYHSDRLYRAPKDLERFIDVVQAAGAEVATVKAGDIDVSTASGRMVARILGSVARHESERAGERVSRAKAQRAAQGLPAGGGKRPYGLTADRGELVPEEADVVRAVAEAVSTGGSLSAEVARLNEAGVRTSSGKCWTVGNLTRILTSPHVAGVRTYKGSVVGEATSPAIIDRPTWEQLRTEAQRRTRGRPRSARYLLSGILTCSLCGTPLRNNFAKAGRRNYVCPPWWTDKGKGCSRIAIVGPALEEHVNDTVNGWIARPVFVEELATHLSVRADDSEARAELDDVEHRMTVVTARYTSGDMSDAEYDAARSILGSRRDAATARLAPRPRKTVPGREVVEMWRDPDLDAETRRALLELLVAHPVPVLPGRDSGRRRAVADRVTLTPSWRTSDPVGAI